MLRCGICGSDLHARAPQATGLSVAAPGGYAERVLVQEALMMPVPNGLSPEMSALTEPLAIGWHAVRRSEIGKREVAIVIGCGPIGLAVICSLKLRGVKSIVASDFSPAARPPPPAAPTSLSTPRTTRRTRPPTVAI